MVDYARFEVALGRIDPTQWRIFERLGNAFLADEFPGLRPTAAMSGDGGMDASVYVSNDDPDVAVQFSVRKDWSAKIGETVRRLKVTAPATRVLIYGTNQLVAADAGALRRRIRQDHGIHLDIRDREWFLSNRNAGARSQTEAEEFCRSIADPISGDAALEQKAQALTDLEAKAAFVYLGLQWADDAREKGLSKLAHEAIVRAVLRDTDSEHRVSRSEVHRRARIVLSAQDDRQLKDQIDGALKRLEKVHIRHWRKPDEFCLTYAEKTRLATRLIEMEALDGTLTDELTHIVDMAIQETSTTASANDLVPRIRRILERVLLDRGEAFASAVSRDRGAYLNFADIEAVVHRDFIDHAPEHGVETGLIVSAIQQLLAAPPEDVQRYLRSLADTYTLFAFMRETPDVQSAMLKIFSDGDIWLDTSVVLPLLVEDLLPEWERSHTRMIRAASEAGLHLYVTPGVVEEISSHINRCESWLRAASNASGAYGPAPFLYAAFRLSGRTASEFLVWIENFRGDMRPLDDIVEYLDAMHSIDEQSLEAEVESADETLKAMISEVWYEAREKREADRRVDGRGKPDDPNVRARLVSHDVENFLGVIQRRVTRRERRSAFGYKSWWLTLDRTAFTVCKELESRIVGTVPASPVISPDFMLSYLSVGPMRHRLNKRTEAALPLMLNMTIMDAVPAALLALADELRAELAGFPPHVVDRKIRDTLDQARRLLGSVGRAGEQGLTDEIKTRLLMQARESS